MKKSGKKKSLWSLQRQKSVYGYLFVAPFLIGLICIFSPMLIKTIQFSFSNINIGTDGYKMEFVGWTHYNQMPFYSMEITFFCGNALVSFGNVIFSSPLS